MVVSSSNLVLLLLRQTPLGGSTNGGGLVLGLLVLLPSLVWSERWGCWWELSCLPRPHPRPRPRPRPCSTTIVKNFQSEQRLLLPTGWYNTCVAAPWRRSQMLHYYFLFSRFKAIQNLLAFLWSWLPCLVVLICSVEATGLCTRNLNEKATQ